MEPGDYRLVCSDCSCWLRNSASNGTGVAPVVGKSGRVGRLPVAGIRWFISSGRAGSDAGGYVGASGSGARDDILVECGYQPMTQRACDDAYQNAYLPCHERAKTEKEYGLAMVELADVNMFNPVMMSEEKVEALCRAQGPISRVKFGSLLCGE